MDIKFCAICSDQLDQNDLCLTCMDFVNRDQCPRCKQDNFMCACGMDDE